MAWETLCRQLHTVFLGEAGCGKSELAVHLALELAEQGREVHFFDLDQTKPLMRSRDAEALLTGAGITVHFQQQYADAPTQVVPEDVVWNTIRHKLSKKPKLLPLNRQAFEAGLEIGRKAR